MSSATMRLFFEPFGHVLPDDPLRQPFDDGGLADARLADEDRVVLRAARQHLDDAADLVVAPDDRIELALARELGEVAAVALERLVRALRVLAGDALGPADRRHRLEDGVLRHAALLEQAHGRRLRSFGRDRDEQVLGADVLVLQPFGFLLGRVGDLPEARRQRRLRAAAARAAASAAPPGRRSRAPRDRRSSCARSPGTMPSRCSTSVSSRCSGVISGIPLAVGELLRGEDRFLCFFRVLVDVHVQLPASSYQLPASSSQLLDASAFALLPRFQLFSTCSAPSAPAVLS